MVTLAKHETKNNPTIRSPLRCVNEYEVVVDFTDLNVYLRFLKIERITFDMALIKII